MYRAGNYYTLRINRTTDNGQYLINEDDEEVLLPKRYIVEGLALGDMMEVFVYNDSEDRLVATTETPLVKEGRAAYLEVVDKTIHGVFLDWGLSKDLFLPVRNQLGRMDTGEKYVVFVYVDDVTGRVTATARLNSFIKNSEIAVYPGDEVDILVAQKNGYGYRVIVNDRNWAMLYSNQIFTPVAIGDRLKAHVRRVTDDNRIDVSLQLQGYDEVKKSADKLMEILREHGGKLHLHDGSSPDLVHKATGMSKKVFKRSVGYLMKKGILTMDGSGISLKSV